MWGWGPWATWGAYLGLGVVLHGVGLWVVRWWSGEPLWSRASGPSRAVVVGLVGLAGLGVLGLEEGVHEAARRGLAVGTIVGLTWLGVRAISVLDDLILRRYDVGVRDNLRARQVHTQVRVISRSLMWVLGAVGLAGALMVFPSVRQMGASLMASAGVAGVVVGLAARPLLANLVAGLQIALTDLVRLDDVVIVEGEWGRIEEITATYVVVAIWDDRRLVVPLNYFLERPFQNWTRRTAELLGTVFVRVDYTVPIEALREELRRVLEGSSRWDGRVGLIQVTEAGERALELRALVSAADAPTLWDLRCDVREALVTFLQREYPDALPSVRLRAPVPSEGQPTDRGP